jgi:hypothetical protein
LDRSVHFLSGHGQRLFGISSMASSSTASGNMGLS